MTSIFSLFKSIALCSVFTETINVRLHRSVLVIPSGPGLSIVLAAKYPFTEWTEAMIDRRSGHIKCSSWPLHSLMLHYADGCPRQNGPQLSSRFPKVVGKPFKESTWFFWSATLVETNAENETFETFFSRRLMETQVLGSWRQKMSLPSMFSVTFVQVMYCVWVCVFWCGRSQRIETHLKENWFTDFCSFG